MSKVEYFRITLDKQQAIYFAGETIFGTVSLKVKERFKINSVKCMLDGLASTFWYSITFSQLKM